MPGGKRASVKGNVRSRTRKDQAERRQDGPSARSLHVPPQVGRQAPWRSAARAAVSPTAHQAAIPPPSEAQERG